MDADRDKSDEDNAELKDKEIELEKRRLPS
jgi:hypothetical protein